MILVLAIDIGGAVALQVGVIVLDIVVAGLEAMAAVVFIEIGNAWVYGNAAIVAANWDRGRVGLLEALAELARPKQVAILAASIEVGI